MEVRANWNPIAALPAGSSVVVVVAAPSVDRFHRVAALSPGSIHRPTSVSVRPGGKGFNAASAARLLGARVVACAPLAGASGRWLDEAARAEGIESRATWVPGELRTCLSVFAQDDGSLTEFYEPPGPVAASDWARFATEAIATTEDEARRVGSGRLVALVSGRLPPGAPDDGLATIVGALRAAQVPTLLDSDGPGLPPALHAGPELVKVNALEAARAAGVTVDGERGALLAADELRRRGAASAVVTLGRAGSVAIDREGVRWRLGPVATEGRYPVGSGDAFLAGLAVAMLAGDDLGGSLRLAAAAAAANADIAAAGVLDPMRAAAILATITIQRIGDAW